MSSPMLWWWSGFQWSFAVNGQGLFGIDPPLSDSVVDVRTRLVLVDPRQLDGIENGWVDGLCVGVLREFLSVALELTFLLVQDGTNGVLSSMNRGCLEGALPVDAIVFESPRAMLAVPGGLLPMGGRISFSFQSLQRRKDSVPNSGQIFVFQPGGRR